MVTFKAPLIYRIIVIFAVACTASVTADRHVSRKPPSRKSPSPSPKRSPPSPPPSCGCPYPVLTTKSNSTIKFAVFGDWGRVGDVKSLQTVLAGGYDYSGACSAGFGDVLAYDAANKGGERQLLTAYAMERACRDAGCEFIVNTGDNFYECGIDSLQRWKTDFEDVYQSEATPYLRKLKWLSILGNHDIVAPGSVEAQIAYSGLDERWVMPDRFFGYEVHSAGGEVRVRFSLINTSPFVTKYAKAGYKYNTTEFRATASPANLSAQTDFLAASLGSSRATWDVVVGHHPLAGSAATVYGFDKTAYTGADAATLAGTSFDLGRPTTDGTPAFAKVLSTIRQYKPVAYFNGHDHVLTHAVDPLDPVANPTHYITTGAGSGADFADSCGVKNRPNVKFSNSIVPSDVNCSAPTGTSVNGFTIVTLTKNSFLTDFYNVDDYGYPTKVYSTGTATNPNESRKPAGGCRC